MTKDATDARRKPERRTGTGEPAPRVLVVDDEPSVRHFADRVLAAAGYDVVVVVAADGPKALRLAEAQRPFNLSVIDIIMPEMRGTNWRSSFVNATQT